MLAMVPERLAGLAVPAASVVQAPVLVSLVSAWQAPQGTAGERPGTARGSLEAAAAGRALADLMCVIAEDAA
jgi:hypothetical protein